MKCNSKKCAEMHFSRTNQTGMVNGGPGGWCIAEKARGSGVQFSESDNIDGYSGEKGV